MAEFTLNGRGYKSNKLDALTQLSIAVKILPIIPALKPVALAYTAQREAVAEAQAIIDAGASENGVDPANLPELPGIDLAVVGKLGEAVNALSDDARNFIIGQCLSVTFRQEGPGWLPLWNKQRNAPVDGINMVEMLQIVWHVVMDNIESFSQALASISSQQGSGA